MARQDPPRRRRVPVLAPEHPVRKGSLPEGTVPSLALTRRPLFLTCCSQRVFLLTVLLTISPRRDCAQRVAVEINACLMQNKILVAFKEFWRCMCTFVDLFLHLHTYSDQVAVKFQ